MYAVGEVRAFEIQQGGRRVGRSWGRYSGPAPGPAGHHRFETRIELEIPGRAPIRSEGELVLDASGWVVRGFERSDAVELSFEREGDALVFTDGTRREPLTYAPGRTPTAVMAHSAILHEELMFALRSLAPGEQTWRLVSLSGGPPTEWTGTAWQSGDTVQVRTSLGEEITLRDGRIEMLRVPGSDLAIMPTQDAWPAWTITGPRALAYHKPADARFSIHEVELPGRAGEPALYGEVLVPEGEGPFPAALYVSSTGREDRHGFAGPPPVDLGSHEITDALAQAGLVVLRFDERGQGRSASGPLTLEGQVEDARRALRTLLVQDAVDPARVVIVGHGEGGLRALHVARRGSLAGVALLATPGRPWREVFAQQSERALEQLPPELRAAAAAEQRAMLRAVESGGSPPPELEREAEWLREMLGQDTAALLEGLRAPVFVAQGSKDFEMDPVRDLAALERALQRGRIPFEAHAYRGLDHRFKPEPGTSSPARYLEASPPVDATFLAELTAWARRVTRAAAPR